MGSRLPHGRRGLKSVFRGVYRGEEVSPSSRKAGIEIRFCPQYSGIWISSPSSRKAGIEIPGAFWWPHRGLSPSSRKAGIEIDTPEYDGGTPGSPSSRKAGIEIVRMCFIRLSIEVAFLTEGGD